MPRPARSSRLLAVVPLVAALASAIPAVRWCAMPRSAVSIECFSTCETGAHAAAAMGDGDCGGAACEAAGTMACGAMACDDASDRPCTGEPDTPICGSPCARDAVASTTEHANAPAGEPAPRAPRAFCLEAPPAATQGQGPQGLVAPAPAADLVAAIEAPEPAVALARPTAFEPPRPRSRPPELPPPVRGPPFAA